MVRRSAWITFAAVWLLVQWSCQSPVEPTAEVVSTPVVVVVRDQSGQPLNGVLVQWVIVERGSSQAAIEAAFARVPGAQQAYTGSGGSPGYVSFSIPVPVANENALVLLKTIPPPDPAYRGFQKNGDFRLDTIVPCGPTSVMLTLIRRIPLVCNQSVQCSPLKVTVAPGQADTVAQGDFVQTDADVVVQQVTFDRPLPPGVQVIVRVRIGNGPPVPIPAAVPQGQPYRIEFTVAAAPTATTLDTVLGVTIVVTQPNGSPCWDCTFPFELHIRPQLQCDCPVSGKQYAVNLTACIGTVRDTTLRVDFLNPNTQCSYRLVVQPNQQTDPSELSIVALNATSGQSLYLYAGQRLDSLQIRFAPRGSRPYRERFVIRIFRQTAQGLQLCDSMITVDVTATSATPRFEIDSARSTLFRLGPRGYEPDTLENCILRDDPLRSTGTLCIRNTSGCDLSLDAELQQSSGLFVFESGKQQQPNVIVRPDSTVCLTVRFIPTQAAVYPLGRCAPEQRNFRASIALRSGNQSAFVPVFGYASLDVECSSKATAVLYEFGAQDANGARYYITINIVQSERDNRLLIGEQLDGRTDSVEIYVEQLVTVGPPPNDANITSAVLATGSSSRVEFNIVAQNVFGLPMDICELFNQYACTFNPARWTNRPTVREGDVLIFRFGGSYGILWVKKLSWSNRSTQTLPQVEVLTCYPFN
ncbi:MAG: hypothetical protein KatS3mg038_0177 [Candidatus Kapaibacterium sp.]|nr:MAG: hypothetical protein KatS3mg038_0177 [Candidatus Kapabacteria bacterium]